MIKCDLHNHSYYSDGVYSPKQVIDMAISAGLDVVSITDHDTVAGVEEAIAYGKEKGIKVLAGVELSSFSRSEIHILGYNMDYKNPFFIQCIENVKNLRRGRNDRIFERLDELGVALDLEELNNAKGNVGRMHIAKQMLKQGYVKDVNEAFEKFLGTGGKAHIEAQRLSPLEAVKLIKRYGGVPVLAHPRRYHQDGVLNILLEGLIKYGLMGIEAYYPSHNETQVAYYKKLAADYNLIVTGGSDFHEYKNNVNVGVANAVLDDYSARVLNLLD